MLDSIFLSSYLVFKERFFFRADRQFYSKPSILSTIFTLKFTLDHSLTFLDHAPLWMTLNFGMPRDDLRAQTIRLKHINAAYFQHTLFKNMIHHAIAPLQAHASHDMSYAWEGFVCHIHHVIQDYGRCFMVD